MEAILNKKGREVVSLDLQKINDAAADYFIITHGDSTTQVKAISDFIEVQLKEKCGEQPYRHEGKQVAQWVLIDYINVVVHVMHPESRKFYQLEEMWSDAVSVVHES